MIQDSAQAVADTAAAVAQVVADTAAAIVQAPQARVSFVGDPVALWTGIAVFGACFALGVFASVWILVRTGSGAGGNQTTLTKLAAIAFAIGLSLLVWETFAVSFLGMTAVNYDPINGWATSLILVGSGGAAVPKIQSTIVQREQAKRGQEPTEGRKD